MSESPTFTVTAVAGLGEVRPGEEIAPLIAAAAEPLDGDVIAISQKIVSKSEGRIRRLAEVEPSARARELATGGDRDPALVELVLAESRRIVRAGAGPLIVETHSGLICANAGIDSSNMAGEGLVTLLPEHPDRSARKIRAGLRELCGGVVVGVLVCDSFGRPWRLGQTEVAIGCAGVAPLDDWRGRGDRRGHELAATEIATIDQIAAAADLVRDKAAGLPVVIVRGLAGAVSEADGPGARALQRPADQDLFR